MKRGGLLRGGLLLTVGNLIGAVTLLIRNVVIARLLSVSDFGVASTLAITMALMEMVSDVGLNRLIVQAKDGEDERLQRALHGIQALRGVLAAVAMFVVADLYARLLGAPEAGWAYRVLAIVPLLRGLSHLDMFRLQREMQFGPFMTATLVSQIAPTLLIWPLAALLHDWRTMLAVIILQQLLLLGLSHLLAKRPYRLGWSRDAFRRSMQFGVPLLLNGALLFAIMQGDRIIVGRELGMETLGWFSVIFMLTLTPTTVLARTLSSLFLPLLSKVQDELERFRRMAWVTVEAGLLIGLAPAVGFAVLGPPLVLILFGQRYDEGLGMLVWLGAMQALRVAKFGPTNVALARGETTNPLIANIFRVAMLPVAFLALRAGAEVMAVAWLALVGEGVGFAASLCLLRWRLGLPLRPLAPPILFAVGMIALILLDAYAFPPTGGGLLTNFHATQIGLVAVFLTFPLFMPHLRRWALARIGRR